MLIDYRKQDFTLSHTSSGRIAWIKAMWGIGEQKLPWRFMTDIGDLVRPPTPSYAYIGLRIKKDTEICL